MARVTKKDGRECVVYYKLGKQKWEYFGRGLEAKKAADDRDKDLRATSGIRKYKKRSAQESPTLNELAAAYAASKKKSMPAVSLSNLWYKLSGTILPVIGHLQATRITATTLDNYVDKRSNSPVMRRVGPRGNQRVIPVKNEDGTIRTIKNTTIHRELSDIQAILNWAAKPENQYILKNPVAGYRKPTRDDEIIKPPSKTEIKNLLKHSAGHLARAMTISYYIGLRPGAVELLGIEWDDLDDDDRTILVRSARKGGPVTRVVPCHDDFWALLQIWRADDRAQKINTPCIIHWRGRRISSIKKAFIAAKHRAGITRRLRPYDLRHAFATGMLKAGADLKVTSATIGHSRTDTTTRIYQHLDLDMHRENINRLPSLED